MPTQDIDVVDIDGVGKSGENIWWLYMWKQPITGSQYADTTSPSMPADSLELVTLYLAKTSSVIDHKHHSKKQIRCAEKKYHVVK